MKKIRNRFSSRRGFTLIEMTMALALSLGIAGVLVGILQQQISFTTIMNKFSFLREDAPQVGTLLTNVINKADNYRIFPDTGNARDMQGAVRSGGKSLRLRFRNPDGTSDQAIVAFEAIEGEKRLNYYFKPSSEETWPTNPEWTISARPDAVTFDNSTGILLVTLTGENGEEVTYAGNPD
jgi:prepilin-type N-terminal cleavage/methylation domain-containing protein